MVKRAQSLRSRPARLPLVKLPPLSLCNPLICLCPWLGSQHPSGGLLALWRSELIISPYVPFQWVWPCNINKYALHGLISHRDQSNVNHISSSSYLNMCMKPPLLGQVIKDVMLFYRPGLEGMLGRPIGIVLMGCGMFPGEVKYRPCEWMRW
jgi:hypothetical protein